MALSETHEGKIELLLADVVLPGIGGKELSDALRRLVLRVLAQLGYDVETAQIFAVSASFISRSRHPDR